MTHLIAPSMLAADFANLQRDVELVNDSKADWFHLDIMDGRFVPNISFGFPVVKAIAKHAKKPLDVHLMIVEPENYIEDFKNAGADILTVQIEACTHLHRIIHAIKDAGMRAGVSLNPHSPVHLLKDVIKDLDLVLIMSVNPGFGGQKFIEQALVKISETRKLISDTGSSAIIEVDGGVSKENAATILQAGANVLVAGSSVFKSEDPSETIQFLKEIEPDTIQV